MQIYQQHKQEGNSHQLLIQIKFQFRAQIGLRLGGAHSKLSIRPPVSCDVFDTPIRCHHQARGNCAQQDRPTLNVTVYAFVQENGD